MSWFRKAPRGKLLGVLASSGLGMLGMGLVLVAWYFGDRSPAWLGIPALALLVVQASLVSLAAWEVARRKRMEKANKVRS